MKKFLFYLNLFILINHFNCAFSKEKTASELISNLGFQPTNSTPIDFELPLLKGGNLKLGQHKGKWLILNFWASWCSPCRMEMPTLESLYQEFKKDNLLIVGISVDTGDTLASKKFIKQYDITFPVAHDFKGDISRIYQASAIPSLYLISPDWKLVGIFRGGKSWESTFVVNQFKDLLKIKTIDNVGFASSGETGNKTVSLPENLIPPNLEIKLDDKSDLLTGEPINLTVNLVWQGEPGKFLVKVPRVELPSDVKRGKISSYTSSDNKKSILTYSYPLTFSNPGKYHLGPITLGYRSFSSESLQYTRHPGLDLDIPEKTFHFFLLFSSISLLCIFLGIFIFIKKRHLFMKRQSISPLKFDWENSLNEIKKIKMEGNVKDYTTKLLELNIQLLKSKDENPTKIKEIFEQVKYSGKILADHEIRAIEKQIEREYMEEEL